MSQIMVAFAYLTIFVLLAYNEFLGRDRKLLVDGTLLVQVGQRFASP